MDQRTTRSVSKAQEKRIAKQLGGRRTPNSGATKFQKSDIYIGDEWSIEAKTTMTPKKSFTIKKQWLDKMKEEQFACNKSYSALCFDFGDEKECYYVIDENMFKQLLAYTQGLN